MPPSAGRARMGATGGVFGKLQKHSPGVRTSQPKQSYARSHIHPLRCTKVLMARPDIDLTVCAREMGYTYAPNGLSIACRVPCSRSSCMNVTSPMPSSAYLMPTR